MQASAHRDAMLLRLAYDSSEQIAPSYETLAQRVDELLSESVELRSHLHEQKRVASVSARRLARLTEELKRAALGLKETAEDLAREKDREHASAKLEIHYRPGGGRLRPAPNHEVQLKESLARIAAHLAGRDPDARVRIELAGEVAFDDAAWRYPDFVQRADKAFSDLAP